MSAHSEQRKTLLSEQFDALDEIIAQLEDDAKQNDCVLENVLQTGVNAVARLLTAYAQFNGKPMPASDDLLEIFKAFVKGDPSLNTVRDNVRELVYYQNCIAMDRRDALPKSPCRMVAHTARHIYLYLRSRSEQEDKLA